MNLLKSKFGQFTVYHRTQKEFESLLKDLEEGRYLFKKDDKPRFIVDAGAHIGLITLYFKICFPNAEILCFEPNPETFQVLQKNIEANQLEGVKAVNAALSDQEGKQTLFGNINLKEGNEPDTRGNSLISDWGEWQDPHSCEVETLKLSSYIDRPVDFLKLDVEGCEMMVLKDLEASGKINLIKMFFAEIHITKNTDFSLEDVRALIKKHSFEISFEETNHLAKYLPEKIQRHARILDAKLTLLTARNKNFQDLPTVFEYRESKEHAQQHKLIENLIHEL